jgi:DNA-binding winged helix-turn-helix (wHTH) protein/tetratricopeptide (TPR) repeat protein
MLGALVYRLGDFLLDTRHQQLMRGNQRVEIAKKPYLILLYLAENRDRLVTRQELLEHFWDGLDVYDQTLSRTVARIRNSLGDSHDNSRYIETRWATGYQYIGPFERVEEPDRQASQTKHEGSAQDAEPSRLRSAASIPPLPHSVNSKLFARNVVPHLTLAFVVIAALAFGGVRMLKRPGQHRANIDTPKTSAVHGAKRKTVAVLTFKNQSGQVKNDWLGTALAEFVSTDLSADGRLRVVSQESVARAASELSLRQSVGLSPETLSALCRDLSADFVVSGSYTLLDPHDARSQIVRVDALLQDANGEVITAFADKGKYEDVFDLASAARSRLIAALVLPGVPNPEMHDLASMTRDPAALKAYMEGLQLVRSGELIRATEKLASAIQLDPSFALAHSALSDVWASRGFQEKQKEEAGLALRLSSSLDREHVLVLKAKYAYAAGDWPTAIQAEQALFTFFPDSVEYGLDLANTQTAAGKPHDADATLQLLRTLPKPASDDARIDLAAASAAQSESDASAAVRFTQTAMAKAGHSGARLLYAHALSTQAGNLAGSDMPASIRKSEEARKICQQFQDDACTANILRRLGVYLVDKDPQAAETDFKAALLLARKIGNITEEDNDLNGLAAILSGQNNYASADKIYRQLLENARSEGSAWGAQMALNNLGNDLFMEANLAEAERIELQALNISQQIGLKGAAAYEELSLSQIRLARGNVLQARNDAQAALTTWTELHYDEGRAIALSALGATERVNHASRKQAERDLREAIRILEASGSVASLAQAHLEMARANFDSGNAKSAADLSRSAAASFANQHSSADEASALGLLALALESLGEHDAAAQKLHEAQILVHSTQARASQLEVDFDAAAFQISALPGSDQENTHASGASGSRNTASPAIAGVSTYSATPSALNSASSGTASQAPANFQLQKVASEARNSGFILLATRAQQMLDRMDQYALKNQASDLRR